MKARAELARYWQRQVQGYETSGLSRRQYCEQQQIQMYQLDYWRRKVSRSMVASKRDNRQGWIPLEVSEEGQASGGRGIGLRLGRVEFEVKPGFDRRLLAEVLQVVGSVC